MERVNITHQVVAKFELGCLYLYLDDVKIGEIVDTDHGLQHSMNEGFTFNQDQIFQEKNEHWQEVDSFIEDSWH